ncbi:hypothetical protein C7212DRAFT_343253 [Tuber magnatum]|uniref:Uncharacterized protein n=1 Tax=Tuber magnatum TaxID=42249 RepID=A0A317SXA5_9PEZI|nr:hypothetical protein C7212DRAFT_343253 [Tuber magnatum]
MPVERSVYLPSSSIKSAVQELVHIPQLKEQYCAYLNVTEVVWTIPSKSPRSLTVTFIALAIKAPSRTMEVLGPEGLLARGLTVRYAHSAVSLISKHSRTDKIPT